MELWPSGNEEPALKYGNASMTLTSTIIIIVIMMMMMMKDEEFYEG